MPITPDTKDWTWVLERPCPECGFDAQGFPREQVGQMVRDNAAAWQPILARPDGLTSRPTDDRWSALEYACHVRDVFSVQRGRVAQALAEDRPTYASMGREERVVNDRYNEQDPATVVDDLAANAEAMAAACAALTDEQWARRGLFPNPTPTERDLRWLARHTIHEGHHHLLDVGRVLRAARGR